MLKMARLDAPGALRQVIVRKMKNRWIIENHSDGKEYISQVRFQIAMLPAESYGILLAEPARPQGWLYLRYQRLLIGFIVNNST